MLWGQRISRLGSSLSPRPTHTDVVAHSPTPSMVSTTASSKGEGKKADAAWLWWCSANKSLPAAEPLAAKAESAFSKFGFWNSLSLIQAGIAVRNEVKPRGALARYVSSKRSNL